MGLFATIERDSPETVKSNTMAHLAKDFKEKRVSDPHKQVNVIIYGYLTAIAASDSMKEEIERDLMKRSLAAISKSLIQNGVPVDHLYIGEFVFSAPKGRKIDLFLLQQGESAKELPANVPTSNGRIQAVNPPKPVKDAELSVNKNKELVLEVTAYKIQSGRRTLVPEIAFKSSTGISPVDISKGFSTQVKLWKPRLEGLLKKIGQDRNADKIEFAVKITGGGALTKEFAKQISVEAAASLKAALTLNVTIPGIKHEIPVELSYSYGAAYRDGRVSEEGKGMITVTLFRFKSW